MYVHVHICKCRNDGTWHPVSPVPELKKTNDAGNCFGTGLSDAVRHFLARYRTEIMDAGILRTKSAFTHIYRYYRATQRSNAIQQWNC